MTDPRDIFGSGGGGGSFPKVEELNGKLVLLKPSVVEKVAKPTEFGGKPGDTQDRVTADCVVFADDGSWETHEDMYFSQVGIVNPCRRALKPGAKPFVLGRIARVPSKIGKEQGFDTTDKIEEGLKAHFASNGKKPKPNSAWGLLDFTPEEGQMALGYLAKSGPLAQASAE
jgi:hypothetical protein